ncbi:MAG: recombination protein RecR, partial [Clostridiales bacterium]|nr:recombination protein RecR [Clostridiales bacterium]
MGYDVAPLSRLIEQFERMPSIGRKTAQRLAFYVLGLSESEAGDFAATILEAHEKIHRCPVCCNLTDGDLCNICSNSARDKGTICVVEDSRDVLA